MCVYLNLSGDHNKAWSTEGCSIVTSRTNHTTTTCACDHMTLFAVLMEANSDTVTRPAIVQAWSPVFQQIIITKVIKNNQSQQTRTIPWTDQTSKGAKCGKTYNGCQARKTYELLRVGTQGVSNAGKRPKIRQSLDLPWNIGKNWFVILS